MKIQCIDNKDSVPNTFLCKISRHTILINCPLEIFTLPQSREDDEEELDASTLNYYQENNNSNHHDLSAVLSLFTPQGKMSADVQYSSTRENAKNCEQLTVFRIPDMSLVDLDSIDLVLISNSQLMLGLPYLTEYMGYKGRIVATEPTIEYAKQRMEELVIYHGQQNMSSTSMVNPRSATHFSQLTDENMQLASEGWRSTIYTMEDVLSCIEKIQPVRYTETLSLFSALNLVAYSSGYSLGSANWVLETSFKKIAFISNSSIQPNIHPAPFNSDALKDVDVVVVSGLSQLSHNELSFEKAKAKLCGQVARTLQTQHNAILVTPSMGILFDLIGDIEQHFKLLGNKEIGHEPHEIPIYVVSPIADQSLKYANICGEWMNADRHDLLYLPQMPLRHGELMQTGAVQTLNSIDASVLLGKKIREPCIVFTGDSTSIIKGSLSWFLNYWGQSELNTCIFIDPNSEYQFREDNRIPKGCKMNLVYLPLDTSLRLENVPSILHTHWERNDTDSYHLLIPKMEGAELVKEEEEQSLQTKAYVYRPGEIINIDLNRNWEKVSVSEKLAKTIDPTVIPNDDGSFSAWASLHGSLHYYNNQLEIQPDLNMNDDRPLITNQHSELKLNTELMFIIKRFEEHFIPVRITKDINGIITIELPSDMNAKIVMDGHCITIVASDNEVRSLLRKITTIPVEEE
ncbi:MAG: beta-lactamase-like protein [Benjaminiella poitrasii]|nr:MAG: beta-lactamase-like protein [Benjaminiella poitrasii]